LGIPVVSKEVLSQHTSGYRNWLEAYVRNHGIPMEWPEKGVRKQGYALPALRRMAKKNAIAFLSNLLAFGATTIAAICKDRWRGIAKREWKPETAAEARERHR
jgi:hypothetical protein